MISCTLNQSDRNNVRWCLFYHVARGIRLFHKGSCLRPPPEHHQFCVWSNCCFRPVNVYLHSCTSVLPACARKIYASIPPLHHPQPFPIAQKTTPALPSSRRNILSCRAYILYIIILAHTNNNIISTFIGKSMFLSQSGIHNNNIIVLLYTQPNTHRTIRVVNVSHNII